MTQEEFEQSVKDAADALLEANRTWVNHLAQLCLSAVDVGLDEDRCVIAIGHHVSRIDREVKALQADPSAFK